MSEHNTTQHGSVPVEALNQLSLWHLQQQKQSMVFNKRKEGESKNKDERGLKGIIRQVGQPSETGPHMPQVCHICPGRDAVEDSSTVCLSPVKLQSSMERRNVHFPLLSFVLPGDDTWSSKTPLTRKEGLLSLPRNSSRCPVQTAVLLLLPPPHDLKWRRTGYLHRVNGPRVVYTPGCCHWIGFLEACASRKNGKMTTRSFAR